MAYFNNAQDFLIALKGEKGDQGDPGESSRWFVGTGITGTAEVGADKVVSLWSGISNAKTYDVYLNTDTGNVYACIKGGDPSTATWRYKGNITGPSQKISVARTNEDDGVIITITNPDGTSGGTATVYDGADGSGGGGNVDIEVDATLKQEGMAADAKAVGDQIEQLDEAIQNLSSGGTGYVENIRTIDNSMMKFFIGTQEEYKALTAEQQEDLFAIITNDPTQTEILTAIEGLLDGTKVAKKAECDSEGNIIADTYAKKDEQQSSSPIMQEYDFFEVAHDEWIEVGDLPEGKTINDIESIYFYDYLLHITNNVETIEGHVLSDGLTCHAHKIRPARTGTDDTIKTLEFYLDCTVKCFLATGNYDPFDYKLATQMSFEVWLRTQSGDGADPRKLSLTIKNIRLVHFVIGDDVGNQVITFDEGDAHKFGLYSFRKNGNDSKFICKFA